MKLILEMQESEVFKDGKDYSESNFQVRKAARGLLIDPSNKKMAFLYVSRKGYHKLPGGGLEKGEDPIMAFKREVHEETGCECEVMNNIGLIIEYRNRIKKIQINYCFVGVVSSHAAQPSFTEKEKRDGFMLSWVNYNEAIDIISKDKTTDYSGNFIVKRDKFLLEQARSLMK